MEIIGIIAVVLLGAYLCFAGGFVVVSCASFGGSTSDKLIGWALLLVGIVMIAWTLHANVSLQVKP